ncbi:MAG: alpha/beta hydrolase [Vicinamibacterales bacterium]
MDSAEFTFAHRFVPGSDPSAPTLLLLHGTGGDESELLPVGRQLWPGAALLSPRGPVNENGMARFFRRHAPGLFDLDDLHQRSHDLANFVSAAVSHYDLDSSRVVWVGYSNGANIAASTLLLRPQAVRAAVLWHAQIPFRPEQPPNLATHEVLMTAGREDPIVPPTETEKLAELLTACGAAVQTAWFPAGHALSPDDIGAAKRWLRCVIGGGDGPASVD